MATRSRRGIIVYPDVIKGDFPDILEEGFPSTKDLDVTKT